MRQFCSLAAALLLAQGVLFTPQLAAASPRTWLHQQRWQPERLRTNHLRAGDVVRSKELIRAVAPHSTAAQASSAKLPQVVGAGQASKPRGKASPASGAVGSGTELAEGEESEQSSTVCSAVPHVAALAQLHRQHTVQTNDAEGLLTAVTHYLWDLLRPPIDSGCTYISLTAPLGNVAVPQHFKRPDFTAEERLAGFEEQNQRHQSHAAGSAEGTGNESAENQQSTLPAREPRIATLLMANNADTAQQQLSRFALHVLTHWLYARSCSYDMLVYIHRHPLPPNAEHFFYFFLKAPAVQVCLQI